MSKKKKDGQGDASPVSKITEHHRRPRFYGGKRVAGNISRVPENLHRAFHTLFAWAYPATMVAQILNARWLCHSQVLVPVPTHKLPKVLEFLENINCMVTEEEIGITDWHRASYSKRDDAVSDIVDST